MPDPSSLIDEWAENLLRDLDPEYARESLWSRLGIRPHPGPQEAFLRSEADITIYGGAAGGGKSFGLLLAPLQWIHVPGFGAVIFRRTTVQVRAEGGLWDDSAEIYPALEATPENSNSNGGSPPVPASRSPTWSMSATASTGRARRSA